MKITYVPIAKPAKNAQKPAIKEVKVKLDESTVAYFKELAELMGISYQKLITSYLVDCAKHRRKPALKWK